MALWVADLPGLHTLELDQSTRDEELIIIPQMMAHHIYPNQKALTLNHIMTRGTELSIFLRPHVDALESLDIETPVIFPTERVSGQEVVFETISASC